ncbi:U-box domain protein [Hokovirus HKV1]|uniref:U-box domain protein n=1 Tax=Hokovirus HKV1 TaxID=1977638 RepID=A0A1V0SH52_9VIRU|nr:U-box domain protein [Hokovirus HKV1]
MDIILEEFKCPITRLLFLEPVLADDNIIYEKEAITKWLATNNKSPMTRQNISKKLIEVKNIKNVINNLIKQDPSLINEQYIIINDHMKNENEFMQSIQENINNITKYNNFDINKIIEKCLDYLKDIEHVTYIFTNLSKNVKINENNLKKLAEFTNTFSNKNIIFDTKLLLQNDHIVNINEINKFIIDKDFDKLFDYKNYFLNELNVIDILNSLINASDKHILYILDNAINKNANDEFIINFKQLCLNNNINLYSTILTKHASEKDIEYILSNYKLFTLQNFKQIVDKNINLFEMYHDKIYNNILDFEHDYANLLFDKLKYASVININRIAFKIYIPFSKYLFSSDKILLYFINGCQATFGSIKTMLENTLDETKINTIINYAINNNINLCIDNLCLQNYIICKIFTTGYYPNIPISWSSVYLNFCYQNDNIRYVVKNYENKYFELFKNNMDEFLNILIVSKIPNNEKYKIIKNMTCIQSDVIIKLLNGIKNDDNLFKLYIKDIELSDISTFDKVEIIIKLVENNLIPYGNMYLLDPYITYANDKQISILFELYRNRMPLLINTYINRFSI